MLRINQFAKELGVTNHDVIEALEKRLGIAGKSHSSNLTDDQISQLRRVFEAKTKGVEEGTPLALHKPSAPVRIVKAVTPPPPIPPPPAPPVLVKKARAHLPRQAAPAVPVEPAPAEKPHGRTPGSAACRHRPPPSPGDPNGIPHRSREA